MKKFIVSIILIFCLASISQVVISPESSFLYEKTSNETSSEIYTDPPIFISQEIPEHIYTSMLGNSIPLDYKDNVDISLLSYLQISYYGFDNNTHVGEMIVNSKLANEVLEIFKELYDIKYPIEKIRLIDKYGADDELSMSDNNTSSFCYRKINNSKTLSNHSIGTAIDINPLYNPYVSNGKSSPASGALYINRDAESKHLIRKNDVIYTIFIKHRLEMGWRLDYKKGLSTFREKNLV